MFNRPLFFIFCVFLRFNNVFGGFILVDVRGRGGAWVK
jgi:hypothetical protein